MPQQRNTIISIAKAIAIILMVIGHAESPDVLHRFLYEFHMPLFFAAAGYFFSVRYLDDEMTFIKKRFKGLYWPFVKWSVIFLVLHNLMFDIGILNEVYGNEQGGVTHPYTWRQTEQCFWNILTAMGGYDQFLNGAFWFFRGLLVASILYLIIYKGFDVLAAKTRLKDKPLTRTLWIPLAVCTLFLLLSGWKTYEGLKIITLVQGGYRELMGAFFFGCGFLFQQWQHKYQVKWWTTLLFAVIVWWFSQYLWANMNWRSTFEQFLSLPLPAILGCLMVYNISTWLDKKEGIVKRFLVFCGDNTLPIFIFHILSFKLVSLIKIWYYGLDPRQIGCHMVIHEHSKEDCFWILYTIAGVGIPLLFTWGYRRLRARWQKA
uniref:Acyltransferase family protein n=1 Tax=uncultured bacterium Contig196 TaxID=1393527 RepID=W0FJX7_9BACT|nr:acyltransferase family protein [uncultured bacterium Contig196]